jgi:MSHA biogenesis protein MshN
MSLINQMLQDLEKRRASGSERGALPNQIRVLPHKEKTGWAWQWAGMAGIVALAALFGWRLTENYLAQPTALAARAPEPQAASARTQLSAPIARLSFELEKIPDAQAVAAIETGTRADAAAEAESAPRKPVAHEAQARVVDKSPPPLPIATAAVIGASARAMVQSAPAAVTTEPVTTAAAPTDAPKPAYVAIKPIGASLTMVDVLPETKVQESLAKPQIDKRAQTLTPQQMAENEYREAANSMNQGRLAEAEDGFRRALQHNPAHTGARQGLFGLLFDGRKNAEAEQLLQEGLKLNPNQPGFAMALASLQYQRGDAAGAIETMQRSAPAAQGNADYAARLAGLLQRQARHKEAIEYYQAALRLAPGSGVWLMGLGISLQALNRTAEAQDAFRRARATNSLNPELQAFVDQRLKQLP